MRMKRWMHAAACLLCLSMLPSLFACQPDKPDPIGTDTSQTETKADLPTQPETDSETEPGTDDEDDPIDPGIAMIPDPAEKGQLILPADGRIFDLDFSSSGDVFDAVGNAELYIKGGEFGKVTVTHRGKTYETLGYRKTSERRHAMTVKLFSFKNDDTLRNALKDGYTFEVTVQYTDGIRNDTAGILSGTEGGMFGFSIKEGRFCFQHYEQSYKEIYAKEKAENGELYHLLGVYSKERHKLEFYVNGELQGSVKCMTLGFGSSPFSFALGGDISSGAEKIESMGYNAIYTEARLYDKSMNAEEARAAYDRITDGLEYPEKANADKPYNPADEYYIKNVKLTGEPARGAKLTLSGQLVNTSDVDRLFKVLLSRPLLSTACENDRISITVPAMSSVPFSYELTMKDGGGAILSLRLLSEHDKVVCEKSTRVVTPGAGYYVGDAHTHSTLSDGHDTLVDNFNSAYNKGQTWIYVAEHNFQPYQKQYAKDASDGLTGFLALTGDEITTNQGHCLEYNTDHMHPTGYSGHMWTIMNNINLDVEGWQAIFDEIISEGGICYMAHPFFWSSTGSWKWPGIERDPTNVQFYHGFTGVEVYNADSHTNGSNSKGTEMAFEFWDRCNLKGEQHYFGICDTDSHEAWFIGAAANALMIDTLSEDAIHEALKTGHFYGTNGMEVRYSLGGKSNGETLTLPASGKATLSVQVGDPDYFLTSVTLYKYTITGDIDKDYEGREVTVLFDREKDGDTHLFTFEQEIDVKAGEFYRVECHSEKSIYGDYDKMGGFAFTNPVWIEQ